MKKIYKDKILNVLGTDVFDNTFLIPYLSSDFEHENIEVFYMSELLKQYENKELLDNIGDKYAMYSNVYSEKDELHIFQQLFDYALSENKKIHIIGITLDKELEILEDYYTKCGFLREDINCFRVDFSSVLVSVSVNVENLIWRGSDYKRMKKEIFFQPPIREAGQTKAMFKGINRGVIASIFISEWTQFIQNFFTQCILEEHILPMTLAKVLSYNMGDMQMKGKITDIYISYEQKELYK